LVDPIGNGDNAPVGASNESVAIVIVWGNFAYKAILWCAECNHQSLFWVQEDYGPVMQKAVPLLSSNSKVIQVPLLSWKPTWWTNHCKGCVNHYHCMMCCCITFWFTRAHCNCVMLSCHNFWRRRLSMNPRQLFFVISSSFLLSAAQQHDAASIENGQTKQQEEIQNYNQTAAMTVVWHHHWWYHDAVQQVVTAVAADNRKKVKKHYVRCQCCYPAVAVTNDRS